MSTLLPELRAKYGEGVGVELFFAFPELQDNEKTYLDANSAIGDTTLTANGVNFAVGQYIVVGQNGNEKTEIVQISTATPPTATLITLQTALVFAHNRGDIARFIPYNQIAAQYSTDGITFNTITAVNIRPDASETYMQRASDLSTYSYKFQFFNSYATTYSAMSDVVSAGGYAANTLWAIKDRALRELGEQRGDLITEQFLNDSVAEGRRMADMNPAIFRWSFRQKFGQVIGQLLSGQWSIPAPATIRDPNTYKNVLSIRIGNQNRPCEYQERRRFNQNYLNVVHATVANAYTSGATTIVLSSTHDLDATGAITVANNSVGDGLISIAYSANNKNTNTLTITAATRNIAAGTDVWQRGIFGLPTAYTIDSGVIYFDVPIKIDYDGMDAKGDWYAKMVEMTQDTDLFDEPFYDLYVSWLKWKIKYLKSNGKIDRDGDTDFKDFVTGLSNLVGQEVGGQKLYFVPDIEGFLSATE